MKRLFLLSPFSFLLLFFACNDQPLLNVTSKGGMNEIFAVVAERDSLAANALREIFATPVEMLNQYEPQFDLFVIHPKGFNKTVSEHRNLLEVVVNSSLKEPSLTAQYDRAAAPQIVVTLSAPTAAAAADYAFEHRDQLLQVFRMAERDRDLQYAARYNEPQLMELVKEQFGLKIDIPKGYRLRNREDNFIWISHERSTLSQGFFIYDYPYAGASHDFDSLQLVLRRNEFAARIPGENPGSHMTTLDIDPDLFPVTTYAQINDQRWARTAGFWEVAGDFMGGPFITYSTLNPVTGRVVAIDLYVFSPQKPKRNFLQQLDHLVYSVSFPEK